MLCIPSIFPPTLDSSFSRFVLRFEISSHSQIPLSLLAFRQDLMYLDLDLSIAFISTDYGVVLESEVADGVAAGGYANRVVIEDLWQAWELRPATRMGDGRLDNVIGKEINSLMQLGLSPNA
ncbi:hypothetical protein V6N13_064689 [Hibiscus sabdariffa]